MLRIKNDDDGDNGADFSYIGPLNVSKVPIITANEDVNAPQAKNNIRGHL